MGSSLATYSILCFVLAIILFMVEIFVPSGGLLGIMAAAAALGGVVMLFQINTTLGLVGAIVCVIAAPILTMVGVKFWSASAVGRWLEIGDATSRQTKNTNNDGDSQVKDLHAYVGKEGVAQTDLRPIGVCLIEDRKENCLAATGMIRTGTPIKVIAIVDNTIKVQALDA